MMVKLITEFLIDISINTMKSTNRWSKGRVSKYHNEKGHKVTGKHESIHIANSRVLRFSHVFEEFINWLKQLLTKAAANIHQDKININYKSTKRQEQNDKYSKQMFNYIK